MQIIEGKLETSPFTILEGEWGQTKETRIWSETIEHWKWETTDLGE